jgi:hypothetical protein
VSRPRYWPRICQIQGRSNKWDKNTSTDSTNRMELEKWAEVTTGRLRDHSANYLLQLPETELHVTTLKKQPRLSETQRHVPMRMFWPADQRNYWHTCVILPKPPPPSVTGVSVHRPKQRALRSGVTACTNCNPSSTHNEVRPVNLRGRTCSCYESVRIPWVSHFVVTLMHFTLWMAVTGSNKFGEFHFITVQYRTVNYI